MAGYQAKKYNRVDFQVSLLTGLIVIVSCYLVFFLNYRLSYRSMIEDLQDRAHNIHSFLESDLEDPLYFDLYTRPEEQSGVYKDACQQLRRIRSVTGVRYLYTATINPDGEFIYVIDGLPSRSPDFRHVGDLIEEECIPDMTRAMNGETVLPQDITPTSWGAVFIAYFPMHNGDEVAGVLGIEFDAQRQYQAYQMMLVLTPAVITLSCLAAIVTAVKMFRYISNPSAHDIANTDFLTGVSNRNAFEVNLHNLDKRPDRKHTALISADLDQLKHVNDTYGHAAGDDYICTGCHILQAALPSNGVLYRIGGDEFAMVLTGSGEEDARRTALQVQSLLDEESKKPHPPVSVSMSIGYAAFSPETDYSLYDTLKRSDELMYLQKRKKSASGSGTDR